MGMKASICHSHLLSKETCCLPKAQIPDDVERLMRLVQPLDYYLLLFIPMGTSGTVRGDVNHIKSGFTSLGARLKAMAAHIVSPQSSWYKGKVWLGADGYCRSIVGCRAGVRQRFGFYIT